MPTIGLRTIPGVGKSSGTAQVQQLIGTPWVIPKTTAWEDLNASIDFIPAEEDPLVQNLPSNMILGAFILRGDMHTNLKAWPLPEDYSNKCPEARTAAGKAIPNPYPIHTEE